MPANDSIHDPVVRALQKDGWTITHDPLTLEFDDLYLFVDVGAERDGGRIAVEIKSFPSKSKVADLQQAVGQYAVYRAYLRRIDPERILYLAVSESVYNRVFVPQSGELVRSDMDIRIVVVDVDAEEVLSWIT